MNLKYFLNKINENKKWSSDPDTAIMQLYNINKIPYKNLYQNDDDWKEFNRKEKEINNIGKDLALKVLKPYIEKIVGRKSIIDSNNEYGIPSFYFNIKDLMLDISTYITRNKIDVLVWLRSKRKGRKKLRISVNSWKKLPEAIEKILNLKDETLKMNPLKHFLRNAVLWQQSYSGNSKQKMYELYKQEKAIQSYVKNQRELLKKSKEAGNKWSNGMILHRQDTEDWNPLKNNYIESYTAISAWLPGMSVWKNIFYEVLVPYDHILFSYNIADEQNDWPKDVSRSGEEEFLIIPGDFKYRKTLQAGIGAVKSKWKKA